MDSRRRSFLAAAGSVVTGLFTGCSGFLEPGEGTNGRNVTGRGVVDAGVDVPTAVESSYPQYQYDAANTGTVPDVAGPTGAIASLFEFGQNRFTPGHRIGSPSLHDGRLYLPASSSGRSTAYSTRESPSTATPSTSSAPEARRPACTRCRRATARCAGRPTSTPGRTR